jgi:F-type H+-transporting ATPase subunit b
VQQADEQLSQQGSAAQSELESSVDGLSATLASRILGVDVGGPPKNVSR